MRARAHLQPCVYVCLLEIRETGGIGALNGHTCARVRGTCGGRVLRACRGEAHVRACGGVHWLGAHASHNGFGLPNVHTLITGQKEKFPGNCLMRPVYHVISGPYRVEIVHNPKGEASFRFFFIFIFFLNRYFVYHCPVYLHS